MFAINQSGARIAQFDVSGATATDWEDMALGPCPGGACLFVGDIGDNGMARNNYAIWRIAEPKVDLAKSGVVAKVTADKLPFDYPNGAKYNAETLLVHPVTGDIYVVSKWGPGKPSTVFRLPQPYVAGVKRTLVKVTDLSMSTADSAMTAGDIHPCGNRILLRTYGKLYEFTAPAGGPFEAAFSLPHVVVPVAGEVQGETVAWRSDGAGYFTVSEGAGMALSFSGCQP